MANAAETTQDNKLTQNDTLITENKERTDDENEKEDSKKEKPRPPPLDIQAAQQQNSNGPQTPTSAMPRTPGTSGSGAHKTDKERKIGHRRINEEGFTTYKKIESSQIMGSIQLGIGNAVGGLASKPERDLLMHDFAIVETTSFPCDGSNLTPGHRFSEFKFKTYSPLAFRYFRDLFGIQTDDFLLSICNERVRELTNPGASGSIFYVTNDDEFIIKTVQHKEGEFLQKLLPGYYMNLNQNPRTLLPKFFGLYCYQCGKKNVRLVVMNNLLPSSVRIHQKYDLKGSTFKRKASRSEKKKSSPTYKDLDFMDFHPEGILLEADTYNALVKTIQRDCLVLESFKIMDYSLLVGIHNLDQAAKEKKEKRDAELGIIREVLEDELKTPPETEDGQVNLSRSKSINRQRLAAFSTAMESIQAESDPIDEEEDTPAGGIPARNSKGERLLLFLGIIDILQSYRLKKKLEHTWKSMLHDGDTVSVHRPSFYAQRFQDFMAKTVFRKIPSPLKHSPSKRKGQTGRNRPTSISESQETSDVSSGKLGELDYSEAQEVGIGKGIKDFRPISLGSMQVDGGVSIDDVILDMKQRSNTDPSSIDSKLSTTRMMYNHRITITHENTSVTATGSVSSTETNSSSTSGLGSTIKTITYTPPHSLGGSTPTHTEGTPSFTGSSSSGDLGCPTTPVKGFEHHPFHPQYQKTKPLSPLLGAERDKSKTKENYHETEMTRM